MIRLQLREAWYRPGEPVLRDVGFTLDRGETLTLLGPSGAGKSTLLHILAGLHKGFAGNLDAEGAVIALIPQRDCLLPWKTVRDNVALLARARKRSPSPARVSELLDRLGLAGLENAWPGQLSGGQYRRVMLGQAFCCEPDLLLMDEPFSALDPETKEQCMALFFSIRGEREPATVFVTHDDREAAAMGGRTLRLEGGLI